MLSATGTNNEHLAPGRRWWLLGAVLLVALVRLWRLPEAGPSDYDSVRNWQVVQGMAHGDFARLFIPGSPGFLVFYIPVALFTRSYLVFQAINALLGVAGVAFFAGWVARQARLSGPEAGALALLGGTSLLLTFSGRDFTPISISMVLFTGLLQSHFARLGRSSPAAALRVAVWLALGLSFNYKFLFALPVLLVLEAARADGLWRQGATWRRVVPVLLAPYVAFGALGVAVGLPWYRWFGFYARTAVPVAANPAGRQAGVQPDGLYYLRYLAEFESPLLLAGFGLAAWFAWRLWRDGWRPWAQAWPLLPYLLFWAGCMLAGMSVLVKAPRGLLFAYLPLAALAVLAGRRVLPAWALTALVLAGVGLNLQRIRRELYAPLPSTYPQVAAWLQAHGATKVASTVGLNLAPYLSEKQTLKTIIGERQLAGLRRQGYQYVLLDGYWQVTGVAHFDSLRRQVPVAAWPAPQLQQRLLYLEHSEFTGQHYAETLQSWRAAQADSLPLRLYRLR
ncbi:hypothetical protein [Hymenobacter ruricola]|uniref:Glycosyltransferase RgtA/B/C/D-like domain-containing protein n=1 Tax=Hymenobacter ruricola TaxID=2791023 RepID=A0ABS0HZE6_9BACT|nr:hypothetical protein [Hymenobacter ruricola]MBF9220027.1 hypothetical protein [Hymenobacter ruricola]